MRKLVLFAVLLVAPFVAKAQYYWDFGGGVGAANYLGEMGGNELTRRDFVSDIKLQQTRQTANAFGRYKASPMWSFKGTLSYICIRGADSLSSNPPRHYRNLSFRNQMFELSGEAQFFFYEVNDLGHTYRYKDNFRAYIGLGIAGLYHNPKAYYNGDWVALRPLETENYRYTKFTVAIPASAGFYFTINKHYRIGWNLSWRTTFTDYLDDASTYYVDKSGDPNPLAAALADRTNHAEATAWGNANGYPGLGSSYGFNSYTDPEGNVRFNKRGDPSHNDSYLTSTVEFSYVFRGKSSLYRSKYSSIFKGKKYKHRKVRAKF